MGVCLATSLGALALAANSFTLAWTHSIEKVRWEESWSVRDGPHQAVLVLERVRVRGHGAGMEPPPGAVLHDGAWEWQPGQAQAVLRLTRSGFTADYEWCLPDRPCVPLGDILPSDGGVTELKACTVPDASTGSPP